MRIFILASIATLAFTGTPEMREHMAIGVVADEETGEMSEIKEVVYAP